MPTPCEKIQARYNSAHAEAVAAGVDLDVATRSGNVAGIKKATEQVSARRKKLDGIVGEAKAADCDLKTRRL